jgi:hypothetical protein
MIAFRHYPIRHDVPHLLLVFLFLIVVYVWSMPRTVVLEDDGFFVIAAYFNSVTHPPGYPLFVMLSHLFTWLPFGSGAFRAHLASACFGALACVVIWYLTRCFIEDRIYAYIAALGLGLSRTFWSQAIIAEVYTLNVLLFLLLMVLVLQCVDAEKRKRVLYYKWLAFIYGLALSNHWPLTLLSTPALLVLAWPAREFLFRNFLKSAPFFILGLLPYAWLVWRSQVVPEYSFYGPIQSIYEFWFYVSRKLYLAADYSQTAGWMDKWKFLLYAFRETAFQFGPFGIVFAAIGFFCHWMSQPGRIVLSMTFAYLGSTVLLILLRNVDFDLFHQAAYQVYPLISYAVVAMWAALGAGFIIERIVQKKWGVRQDFITVSIAVLFIAATFITNIPYNFRKNDYMASDYARLILGTLEPDAVFYANADNIDGPVRYLHAVEGMRPDVTVFTGRYIYIDEKLYRPYLLEAGEFKSLVNYFISNTKRPIYYVNDFPNDYAREKYGFFTRVETNLTADREILKIMPEYLDFLVFWKDRYNRFNLWNRMHYNLVLSDYCDLILNARFSRQAVIDTEYLDKVSDFVCANYQGMLKQIQYALNNQVTDMDAIDKYFRQAVKYQKQAFTKEEMARLHYYKGIHNLQLGNAESARINFRDSLEIWPHPDNPAQKMLSSL